MLTRSQGRIHQAIKDKIDSGDEIGLKELIENNSILIAEKDLLNTDYLLQLAVIKDNVAIIKILHEAGAEPIVDRNYVNMLEVAITWNSQRAVIYLIYGMKLMPNEDDLLHSIEKNKIEFTKIFIRWGVSIFFKKGEEENTILHFLAVQDIDDELMNLILSQGFYVNVLNKKKRTPLHVAIMYGKQTTAKILIRYRADVNAEDALEYIPLNLAIAWTDFEFVKLLLGRGALTNKYTMRTCMNHNKYEVAEYLLLENLLEIQDEDIFIFPTSKRFLMLMINHYKGDIGSLTNRHGVYLLFLHITCGDIEFIKFLLSKGCSFHVPNTNGGFPIDWLHCSSNQEYKDAVLALSRR